MTDEEMDLDNIRQVRRLASQIRRTCELETGDPVADALDTIASMLQRIAERIATS